MRVQLNIFSVIGTAHFIRQIILRKINRKTIYQIFFWILNILTPLICGAIVYFYFRPDSYISIFLRRIYASDIAGPDARGSVFSYFMSYYLPDMLWSYSLTFVLSLIFGHSAKALALSGALTALFEIGVELSQRYGLISGTFDIFDILAEAAAAILAIIIISTYFYKGKDKQS